MIGTVRTPADARWYRLAVGTLVVLAWAVLVAWGASPFAGLLDHRGIGEGPLPVSRVALFTAGWTLMIVAMMLPGSLPLVNLFGRMIAARSDGPALLTRLILGYLGVWTLFGAAAFRADAYVHAAVATVPAVAQASQWIGVAILLLAAVYQVTPLKDMCLTKCRSPYLFLAERWRGKRPAREALTLGVHHGIFCVGCCWTLMLLMFAVGGVNLGWMLALGAVMAAERSFRWGRYLTVPLGAALLLLAVGLVYRAPFITGVFRGS
jgi:predicted metal-binding membrane protein